MSYVASGITGASPIWNKIITYALKDKEDSVTSVQMELQELKAEKESQIEFTKSMPQGDTPQELIENLPTLRSRKRTSFLLGILAGIPPCIFEIEIYKKNIKHFRFFLIIIILYHYS